MEKPLIMSNEQMSTLLCVPRIENTDVVSIMTRYGCTIYRAPYIHTERTNSQINHAAAIIIFNRERQEKRTECLFYLYTTIK